jgi:hypothetical protein
VTLIASLLGLFTLMNVEELRMDVDHIHCHAPVLEYKGKRELKC